MNLFEKFKLSIYKIKDFFTDELPEPDKKINPQKALDNIEYMTQENEQRLKELEEEIESREQLVQEEVENLKNATTDRQKKMILTRISFRKKEIQTLDDQMDIHTKNIEMYDELKGKIERQGAMKMVGVHENTILDVTTDFEEKQDNFQNVLYTGEASDTGSISLLSSSDMKELRKLEEEILGKKKKQ